MGLFTFKIKILFHLQFITRKTLLKKFPWKLAILNYIETENSKKRKKIVSTIIAINSDRIKYYYFVYIEEESQDCQLLQQTDN